MSTLNIETAMNFTKIGALSILIDEDATGDQAITLSSGSYFHGATGAAATGPHPAGVTNITDLRTYIYSAWDGFTAGTVTVTFDRTAGTWTLAASGLSTLDITLNTVAQQVLGMAASLTGALSYTSTVTLYYWIGTAMGCASKDSQPYEGENDIAKDTRSHDGSTHGIAKDGAPIWRDWTHPLEPSAALWKIYAVAATPWTWEHFFGYARNVHPFALYDGTTTRFYKNRAEGASFKPLLRSTDYYGSADIAIRATYLGAV